METPKIQPMPTAEIIATAFHLFKRNLALLVIISAVSQVVLLALLYGLRGLLPEPAEIQVEAGTGEMNILPAIQLMAATALANAVMNAVAFSAITAAVAGAALGFPPTVLQTYVLTFRNRLIWVVLAYVIAVIMISTAFGVVFFMSALILGPGLAMIMSFLPALVLGSYLSLTVPVIVLESRPPLQAIGRSVAMMREELPKGMAVFGFVILISGILPLIIQLVIGPGPFLPLLGAAIVSVTLPLAFTTNVILYFAVRAKEGYSAELLEADLAERMKH